MTRHLGKGVDMNRLRAGVIVISVLMLGIFAGQASAQTSRWQTATYSDAQTNAPSQIAPPSTSPSKIVLQANGSSDQTTSTFAVPSEWSLSYSYDCTEFSGSGGGDLSMYIRTADGSYSRDNSPLTTSPSGGAASATKRYHTGGTFSLDVVSDCLWTATVTAP
jgi:hypothetical protein